LSSPIIATPHPHSNILSGYLKDEAAGEERALVQINVLRFGANNKKIILYGTPNCPDLSI
jgi:hypothetical protein